MAAISPNKWILVTGSNKGLGFELVKVLLEQKHPVIAAARSQQKAEEAVAQLRKQTGKDGILQPLELDPSSSASIKAAAKHLQATRDQKLGALVNNAGMLSSDWSQEAWDQHRAVNFDGALELCEALLPVLAEGGRIVNVTSELGVLDGIRSAKYRDAIANATSLQELRDIKFDPEDADMKQSLERGPRGDFAPYRITKGMLNRATQLLAADDRFVSRNISVSSVTPGWCRTDLGSQDAIRSARQGAESIAYSVTHKQPQDLNGKFIWADNTPHDIAHF